MALSIRLKPGERIIVGGAVLRNHDSPCRLTIENRVPVLREQSILSPAQAKTPVTRLYLALQLLYVDEKNEESHYRTYWPLTMEVALALPQAKSLLEEINQLLFHREYYQALRLGQQLVELEKKAATPSN